jgi:undecaprenyl-diphosphatase
VDALDPLFVALSIVGFGGLVWVAVAVALAFVRRRPSIAVLVATAVWSADLLALALKPAVDRQRPNVVDPEPEVLVGAALDLSFPSGHAASSFAGAAVLTWLAPRLAVPFVVLALAISYSRVYVGVHYPADVAAGALLGLAVAAAALALLRARAPRWPGSVRRRSPPGPRPG